MQRLPAQIKLIVIPGEIREDRREASREILGKTSIVFKYKNVFKAGPNRLD